MPSRNDIENVNIWGSSKFRHPHARFRNMPQAPTTDATAGARTWTALEILGGLIVRDCGGASRADVLPTAALLVAAMLNPQIGDIVECKIINGSDANEVITLGAGAGGSFETNYVAASRVIPQNAEKLLMIRITGVAVGSEAYVIY